MFRKIFVAGLLAAGVIGCENKTESGALIGGAGGALLGAGIGSMSHGRAGAGALIGGVAGAAGGALVGHEMDKSDEKRDAYRDRDTYRETRAAQPAGRVSTSDVINWSKDGTSEDVIVDRIQRSGAIRLSSVDEKELRDAGVSDRVIRAMRDSGG